MIRPVHLPFALALSALAACGSGSQPSASAASTAPAPIATLSATGANAQPPGDGLPTLATNAPKDKPVSASGARMAEIKKGMAPLIEKARQTFPDAKKRYLAGLPRGEAFFVTVVLHDKEGTSEQVFIAVTGIRGNTISGKIASDILTLQGFQRGQAYSLDEADLIDWLISKPDGTEEGNLVGKYLDSVQ
ncbi:MAG: DUF2314 domain-containing protein [Polyangiaceae bacterium]